MANKIESSLKEKWHLAALILLFLIIRIWFLITRIIPVHTDELYIGTVANEIASTGLKIPISYCQIMPHAGGTIVVEFLTALFFSLFDNSYLTLKSVALFISLLSFIFFVFLLEKYFDSVTAVLGGLFLIFAPSLYSRASLMLLGNHCESLLFSAVTIYIFYYLFYAKDIANNREKSYLYILLGLLCGFALYFDYIFASVILTFLVVWFANDRKFLFKKYFWCFFISCLIGFTPSINYNLIYKYRGIRFLIKGYSGGQENPYGILIKIKNYLVNDIPSLFDYRYDFVLSGTSLIRKIFFAVLVISFFYIIYTEILRKGFDRKNVTGKAAQSCLSERFFFVIYIVIFSIIYLLSPLFTGNVKYGSDAKYVSYYLSFRYLIPLFPPLLFVMAFFVKDMLVSGKNYKKAAGWLLIVFFCVSGFIAYYNTPGIGVSGKKLIDQDGYSYSSFASEMFIRCRRNNGSFDVERLFNIGDNINQQFTAPYFYGAGVSAKQFFIDQKRDEINAFNKLISGKDIVAKSYFYEGIGYGVGFNNKLETGEAVASDLPESGKWFFSLGLSKSLSAMGNVNRINSIESVRTFDSELRKAFYPALGYNILLQNGNIEESMKEIETIIDDDNKSLFFRGLGALVFYDNAKNPDSTDDIGMILSPERRKAFFEGIGMMLSVAAKLQHNKINILLSNYSNSDKKLIYRGIARTIIEKYYYDFEKSIHYADKISDDYLPSYYEGLGAQTSWRFNGDEEILKKFIDKVSLKYRISFQQGFTEEWK